MIKLHHGADLYGPTPHALLALTIASSVYKDVCGVNTIVTGMTGNTLQLRTRHVGRDRVSVLLSKVREALRDQYQVVLRDPEGPGEQLEIEYHACRDTDV